MFKNKTLLAFIIIYIICIILYILVEHFKEPGYKLYTDPITNQLKAEEDKDPWWYTPIITLLLTTIAIITSSLGDYIGTSYSINDIENARLKKMNLNKVYPYNMNKRNSSLTDIVAEWIDKQN